MTDFNHLPLYKNAPEKMACPGFFFFFAIQKIKQ